MHLGPWAFRVQAFGLHPSGYGDAGGYDLRRFGVGVLRL